MSLMLIFQLYLVVGIAIAIYAAVAIARNVEGTEDIRARMSNGFGDQMMVVWLLITLVFIWPVALWGGNRA